MENYFNYFTEVEELYQKRRGTGLLLSTIDWALIETWKDAGIPLAAVLRGIDATFDKYDQRPQSKSTSRKINSLAYCSQEVLAAAEELKEAAIGARKEPAEASAGLGSEEIARFFRQNAEKLQHASAAPSALLVAQECAATLTDLASTMTASPMRLEELERRLSVLEEKLLAALTVNAAENELFALRTEADREIAPYRSKMPGAQIQQLQKQFMHKRLFEKAKIPRLSLFYL